MVSPTRRQHIELGGHHHGGLRGDVDVLPEAIALTRSQRNEGAGPCLDSRILESLRNGGDYWWPIFVTGYEERTPSCRHRKIGCCPVCLRSILSVGRDVG